MLSEGMELEGVVTNIVAFGAFVDVGVHQDGLVHVSQLADRYITDPNAVVSVGQKVTGTRALGRSGAQSRIALSMRKDLAAQQRPSQPSARAAKPSAPPPPPPKIPKRGDIAPNGMRFR